MEWQSAFNIAAGIAGAFGGWMLRVLWDEVQRNRRNLEDFAKELPNVYARRDDVKALGERMDSRFDRLEDWLSQLAGRNKG